MAVVIKFKLQQGVQKTANICWEIYLVFRKYKASLKMRAALLYVSVFSLLWAQSVQDIESHYKKAKQKCMGEHQITVKGRHNKHGFYIFNYMYSSSTPNNQTQIKKEDNDKNISNTTPRFGKVNVSKKPLDNLTEQLKGEQQKHLAEMEKDGKFEDRRHIESGQNLNGHHGNPGKWGLYQHHFEFIVGKGGNERTGDTGVDGSGDMESTLNLVDSHHSVTVDGKDHDPDKEHQVTRGRGYDRPLEKDKDGKSGPSGDGKPSKGSYIKIGEKKTGASIFQDVSSNGSIPQKSKDSQSKVYSKVLLKGTTDSIHKGPGREGGGDADLLIKTKEDHTASSIHMHHREHGNISISLSRNRESIRSGRNISHSSDMDEIKIANGKVVKIQVEKEGADEHPMISRKVNGEKDKTGVTKPAPKGEVGDHSFSGSHVEVSGAIQLRKKDSGREDIMKGRPSSHREATGFSKTYQNNTSKIGVTGRLSSQAENPIFTTAGKTGQQEVKLSGKLIDHVIGAGVTKSHPKVKDEVTILKIISGSRASGPGSIQESKKGNSGLGIIHRKFNTGKEGFSLTSTHPKEVGSHERINRKTQEGSKVQEKGEKKLGLPFQEAKQDIVKGNIENRKVTGVSADLKRSDVDSSKRKAEHSGQKSTGIKSALSLHHGSHDTIKHGSDVPMKDDLKSPEHSSSSYKKVTKTSKQRSKTTAGTDSGDIAKKHHGHSGIWRKKSSRPDRKKQSVKRAHGSDSSPSSESDEDSRNDSRRSYKDYQNDTPDSYQSVESTEQNLSLESNQSDDDHSQMEDQETYSQESSHEHKHN